MYSFKNIANKTLYTLSSILSGLCVFILLISLITSNTIFTSDYHTKLFAQQNIYSHVEKVIENSLKSFSLEKLPIDPNQKLELKKFIESIAQPKMIKKNLDDFKDQLFKYLNNDRDALPDISLASKNFIPQNNSGPQILNLEKVKKISLETILMYINRTDISSVLLILKFIFFVVKLLPNFAILSFLVLFLIGIILCNNFFHMLKWLNICITTVTLLSFISFGLLIMYEYFMLPWSIYPISMSLPLGPNIILSYLKECILEFSLYILYLATICVIIFIVLKLLSKYFVPVLTDSYKAIRQKAQNKVITYSLYGLLSLFIFGSFMFKISNVMKEFKSSDFATVFYKFNNAVTEVIAAKDATIYSIQVKVLDEKYNIPLSDIGIKIDGLLEKNSYSGSQITNNEGIADFSVGQGTFRLTFESNHFPSNYEIPLPYFFEVKDLGTTMITLKLKSSHIQTDIYGIAEIEVIDKNNNPVENIALKIENKELPGTYSYTNAEGIAVFKLTKGSYKVKVADTLFPKEYIIPKEFQILISENSVTRYTLKLARFLN